jgi:hypothetical protein
MHVPFTFSASDVFRLLVIHALVFYLPRYHVGESLIPSIRHYMRFIGAEEKLANHGFVRKVRVIFYPGIHCTNVPLENSQVPPLNLINSNGKDVRLLQSAPPSASFMTSRLLFLDTDFVALGHNNNAWNVVCPPFGFFSFTFAPHYIALCASVEF